MRAHRLAVLALAAVLFTAPVLPARATGGDDTGDSRVGVVLMIVCGLALKVAGAAPIPWAGIAVASCLMGLVDAANSPDP